MLHTALSGLEDLSSVIFQKLIISFPSFIILQLAGNLKNSIKKGQRVGVRESHLWRFRVRGEYAVAKRTPRFSTEFYTCTHTPSAKALSWTSCNLMFLQDSKLSKCRQKRHYEKAVPVLFCKMLSSQSYCQKHEKCMLCLLLAYLARALVLALLG